MRRLLWSVASGVLAASGAVTVAQAGQIIPAHSQDVRRVVSSPVSSLVVTGDYSNVTLRPGRTLSVLAHEEWNLYQPELLVEVRDGVLKVSISCGRPDGAAAALGGGLTDTANDCVDDLTVTVPTGVEVQAQTGSGNVQSTGLRGEQQLRTGAGDLDVRNATGPDISAITGNGDVHASSVTAGVLDTRTDAGDVTVSGIRASTRIDVTSGNGTLRLTDLRARSLSASTNAGDVLAQGLRTSLVLLRTANGTINSRLDAAPDDLTARSDSGDVTVDVPSGRYDVQADTASGLVRVTGLTSDPDSRHHLRAHTGAGDVTVRGE